MIVSSRMPMRVSSSRSVSAPDILVTPRHSLARSASPLILLALAAPAVAQQVQLGPGSVVQTVTTLKAGQFVWAPQAAPEGVALIRQLGYHFALDAIRWRIIFYTAHEGDTSNR